MSSFESSFFESNPCGLLPTPSESTLLSASHWGLFHPCVAEGRLTGIRPFEFDERPSANLDKLVELAYSRNRILRPHIREGFLRDSSRLKHLRGKDRFIPVSWETALEISAKEIRRIYREFGPQAMFGRSYGWKSTGLLHSSNTLQQRLLNLCGGFVECANSYSTAAVSTIQAYITGNGDPKVTSWPNIVEHAERIVFWGSDPLTTADVDWTSGLHRYFPYFKALKAKGTRTWCINPIRTPTAEFLESRWLAPVPGTDSALMLGVMHEIVSCGKADEEFLKNYTVGWEIFKDYLLGRSDGIPKTAEWAASECGLTANAISSLAHDLADHRTMIMIGWGPQRARFGEQFVHMAWTLACALGQIGLEGGGIGSSYHYSDAGAPGRIGTLPSGISNRVSCAKEFQPFLKGGEEKVRIPVASFVDCILNPGAQSDFNGRKITYPDIRMIMWAGGNPFAHQPDTGRLEKAWQKPDTVIVTDTVWSATALHADIVLSACTSLERNDITGIGTYTEDGLCAMHRAIEPPGEAKSDFAIFSALSQALGIRDEFTCNMSEEGWIRSIYESCRQKNRALGLQLPDFDTFWLEGFFLFPEDPADHNFVAFRDFRNDPAGHPLLTESGRFEIFCKRVASFGYKDCTGLAQYFEPEERKPAKTSAGHKGPLYPFALISCKSAERLHSQLGNLQKSPQGAPQTQDILLHTKAASLKSVRKGDLIEVFNDRGCVRGRALPTEGIREDSVVIFHGGMYMPCDGKDLGASSNTLTKDVPASSLSRGNVASYGYVQIRKAAEKNSAPFPCEQETMGPKGY